MSDKLKTFIAQHGKVDLPKPEAEWREIMKKVDSEKQTKGFRWVPIWLASTVVFTSLAIVAIHNVHKTKPVDPALTEFLVDADDDPYESDMDLEDDYPDLVDET